MGQAKLLYLVLKYAGHDVAGRVALVGLLLGGCEGMCENVPLCLLFVTWDFRAALVTLLEIGRGGMRGDLDYYEAFWKELRDGLMYDDATQLPLSRNPRAVSD